ncbi:Septum formation protein Maf [Methanosarcina barkeri str. Wiesmoor]|uniref:dTTP/UTP pyrophosphatase n=2 Tax=Methanosarcina barkeri TaxID=2208 RepID=NTPPA_METBF|nr:Maf family nucleotide pyrophosphatase [Methanosarcina barkeri]Q46BZ6.1 RecName: Full=dTTP/UTP pyrophosphatase; Short=dTTPase/UTPase; AltName: Full=Nucleoside triphosphate pyrophosphatase; AltName: Full=Nucleotide pyrophosphatase; Short=Nucleotide PPase [Methanosarcina barkeri str. Fusaro]AKB52331.1 Septum formation protein Maf [Methanosarcina barkeri str. Wiesmoor]
MRQIILASASPRRKELLKQLIGDNFLVYASSYEESPCPGMHPKELLLKHSAEKARDVAKHFNSGLVISADTSVFFNGELLGKPKSSEEAEKMLKLLSGQRFLVITGLTVLDLDSGKEISELKSTTVWMDKISNEQISAYVRTGEPLDKAGAFAVQGKGAAFVEKIEGDFFNVVGLPLFRLGKILQKAGVSIFEEGLS